MKKIPNNQIICGDNVDKMNEMPEKSVDLVFADPPYNLQLQNDLWRPNQTLVDAVDDEWDSFVSFEAYDTFTERWLKAAQRILKDTGTIWVMGSHQNIFRVGKIMQDLGFWTLNDILFIKSNPMPNFKGTRFCNAHETLIWAKKSQTQKSYTFHYKNVKSGNEDKQMRSDWYGAICSGQERIKDENGNKAHSTQKPEWLLHRVIATTTNPGDVILDPFVGSGTTCAVAKKLGRNYIGIDLEQSYVDIANQRLQTVECGLEEVKGVNIDAVRPKVPFVSLVERGLLTVGQELEFYKTPTQPTGIFATVHSDGTITAQARTGSIHKVGKEILNSASCNGWMHWYCQDKISSAKLPIDYLRN